MIPPCSDRISRVPPYSCPTTGDFLYGALTLSGRSFQSVPVSPTARTGLVRVRSPLLAESRLISFPPGTEMFQFPGFASGDYGFIAGYRLRGGLPHSDIHGSKPARGSPWLFAACHVLLRLLTPRHPPNALLTLDPNHPSQPNSTLGIPFRIKPPDKISSRPKAGRFCLRLILPDPES